MAKSTHAFWAGFALGAFVTILLVIGGLVAFGALFTGPRPAVHAAIPDTVVVGEPFVITITASNPHEQTIVLDNVEFPDRFFEGFEILEVRPEATGESPVRLPRLRVWYFDHPIEPGETRTLEFTARATRAGGLAVEFGVCNSYEDCAGVTRAVQVAAAVP